MSEKEYSLKDLYNEQSDEEEEGDSDFMPEEHEESSTSDVEECSETEQEEPIKKRPLEDSEDATHKKARIDAIWKDMNEPKKAKETKEEKQEKHKKTIVESVQAKKKIQRPKSSLSSLVSHYNIKVPKMNTLEKSKLDWQKYVEKEGIKDELKYKNKDGYTEKIEFLQRVDDRRLEQLKSGQRDLLGLSSLATLVFSQDNIPGWIDDGPSKPLGVTGNVHYANLLNASLYFYEAQRSGKLPADNRVNWRHDSGLKDGSDNNVNLTGGYYDAGDYLKFSLPLAHSLISIAWSASTWYDGYQKANQTQYLDSMLRWGLDWIMQAHPDKDTFYVQVGDGDVDNNYWGPDTNIPTPRPSYQVNRTAIGTDAVALASAALASASYLYKNNLNDTDYASKLLAGATSLFDLAYTAEPRNVYTKAIPAIAEFYNTNNYTSQLTYSALWMYRATGNSTYKDTASNLFDSFNMAKQPVGVLDWSDQSNAVFVLGAELDSSNTKYTTAAQRVLDTVIQTKQDSPCHFTNGGLLWCDGFSDSNSLVPAQDTAQLALFYARLDSDRAKSYREFAAGQINYMLGNNFMKTPYVCGIHINSPQNPHHAGASGGTDIGNINSPAVEEHVLYGAIVGGPDQDDKFFDERNDWAQTEVALDYNAPFQGLIAYQLSTDASDPPYVTITDPRPSVSRSTKFPGWIIAVIVVVVLFILALAGFFIWRRYQKKKNAFNKA